MRMHACMQESSVLLPGVKDYGSSIDARRPSFLCAKFIGTMIVNGSSCILGFKEERWW